jgi:hypothetical protein
MPVHSRCQVVQWLMIIFVLLKSGDMRVFDGFEDVTGDYQDFIASNPDSTEYLNEAQNEDPEAYAYPYSPELSGEGVLSEPEEVREPLRGSPEDWTREYHSWAARTGVR